MLLKDVVAVYKVKIIHNGYIGNDRCLHVGSKSAKDYKPVKSIPYNGEKHYLIGRRIYSKTEILNNLEKCEPFRLYKNYSKINEKGNEENF